MTIDPNFFKPGHQVIKIEKGISLISEPFLADKYFGQSVVLLTEHSPEGSVGFVINKPASRKIHELIAGFPEFDAPVSLGGPVAPDTLHFIHTLGSHLPGSQTISEHISYGGNFDLLETWIRDGRIQPSQIKFFLGYSGWTTHQLAGEVKSGSWVLSHLPVRELMPARNGAFWRSCLQNLGEKYRLWANFPADPLLN